MAVDVPDTMCYNGCNLAKRRKESEIKKTWEKSKLIVLVRGEPGERILQACKTDSSAAQASTTFSGCDTAPDGAPMALCIDCSTEGVS